MKVDRQEVRELAKALYVQSFYSSLRADGDEDADIAHECLEVALEFTKIADKFMMELKDD
jgi:hypothetical protein